VCVCVEGDHSIKSNPDAIKETEKKKASRRYISTGRDRTSTAVSDCAWLASGLFSNPLLILASADVFD